MTPLTEEEKKQVLYGVLRIVVAKVFIYTFVASMARYSRARIN